MTAGGATGAFAGAVAPASAPPGAGGGASPAGCAAAGAPPTRSTVRSTVATNAILGEISGEVLVNVGSGGMNLQKRAAHNTSVLKRATQLRVAVAQASSSPRIGHSPRRRSAWSGRATGAVVASAFAHALAAVTVGAVLQTLPKAPLAPAENVDVDVVALDIAAPARAQDQLADQLAEPPAGPAPNVARPQSASSRPPQSVATLRRSRASAAPPANVGAPPPPASATSVDDSDPPSLFVLSAGTVATRAAAAPSGSASSPPRTTAMTTEITESASGDDAVGERDVSEPARLLSSSPLVYPPAARQAEIEIDFPVEIVVDAQGRVISARAVTHAGYGLDEAALRAIRAYRFSPAQRAGRPVGVRMRWTVQFRLR